MKCTACLTAYISDAMPTWTLAHKSNTVSSPSLMSPSFTHSIAREPVSYMRWGQKGRGDVVNCAAYDSSIYLVRQLPFLIQCPPGD